MHPDWPLFEEVYPHVRRYQALAMKHGIDDIFQDNGGKLLQLLLVLNLQNLAGREGNDAQDDEGNEYELKTVNVLKQDQVTTHHHLNLKIIEKYRKADWFFGMFSGIELVEIYHLKPSDLEPYFAKWSAKWIATEKDINNPKIPLKFVKQVGTKVYP